MKKPKWNIIRLLFREEEKNPEAKELVFTGDLEKYDDCEVALDIISMTTNVMFTIRDRAIIVQMK